MGNGAVVATGMAQDGGVHRLLLGKSSPRKGTAGVEPKLADELALGAAIAFAKGMDGVDLTEIERGSIRKSDLLKLH